MMWRDFYKLAQLAKPDNKAEPLRFKDVLPSYIMHLIYITILYVTIAVDYLVFRYYLIKYARKDVLPKEWQKEYFVHPALRNKIKALAEQGKQYISEDELNADLDWRIEQKVMPYMRLLQMYQFALIRPLVISPDDIRIYYENANNIHMKKHSIRCVKRLIKVYKMLIQKKCGGEKYINIWNEKIKNLEEIP